MPEHQDIQTRIYTLLQPLVGDGHKINADTDLVADLGLDSLQVMKLLEAVEDHFDISIPLNILPDIRTVKDFAVQLEKLTGEADK